MSKPKSDYVIQTVTNALRLLEAFGRDEELGVTELSRRLSLHKNNVFRLLATLEEKGYVKQCADNERYRLDVRCLELGHSFTRNQSLLRRARPVLEALVHELGETAHLAVLRDYEVVHLDGEAPDHLLISGLRVGRRLPAHCTALGKVLLGCASGAARENFDREMAVRGPLKGFTPATLVDLHKFFDALRAVASAGFALDVEECEEGLSCAAAPVWGEAGELLAALSVSGPSTRFAAETLHRKIVPSVVAAAEQLSRKLGYSPDFAVVSAH